jgi:HAE1 family hydrophobic/amphiphilic exporter-1/multidrug efflux pump
MTGRYVDGVTWMLRRGLIALLLFAGMVALTFGLWRATPGSLVPDEDQGYYIAAVFLPDGATLERTDKVVNEVVEIIKSNPANETAIAFTGLDFLGGGFRNSAATIFVTQKHWDERTVSTGELVGEFFMKTAHIKEGLALAFGPPPIFGLGNAGGFEFYIQNRGEGGAQKLSEATQQLLAEVQKDPMFGQVNTLWRANVPQLYVETDREKAKTLGVPIDEVYSALSATLGTAYINDFNKFGRTWQVLMSAEPAYRKRPEDIGAIYVRSDRGAMVPLSALAKVNYSSGPDSLDRFNNLPAVKIFGSAKPGYSSGEAIAGMERIAQATLPSDFTFDWGGASFQEKRSGGTSVIALGLAALMVFLILAAQYNRWSLPLAVMLALPFGTFGALLAIFINNLLPMPYYLAQGIPWLQGLLSPLAGIARLSNDVYFQIGLVTLLGLAAKNAILIVEFAVMKKQEGLSTAGAAIEAARLRFRPILMTSLAFILGVVPLVISSGAGAGARHSAGTGVMGGMLAATFLAIFFIPWFYKLIIERKLSDPRSTKEIEDEVAHHRELMLRSVQAPHHTPVNKGDDDAK